MTLPDVSVRSYSAPTPSGRPAGIDTAFYVAQSLRGWKNKPRLCHSLTDVVTYFGERQVTTYLYDWADTFFNEGGTSLYISRAYHSDAVIAKLELTDSGTNKIIVLEAGSGGEVEPGVWGNSVEIIVTNTSEAVVLQTYFAGTLVEESPSISTIAGLVGWVNTFSSYLTARIGANGGEVGAKMPKTLAKTALASGANGSAVTDSDYKEALERIGREYGAGQVAMETGNTGTATRQLYLLEHAKERNRFALLDGKDEGGSTGVTALKAQATALYGAGTANSATEKARRDGQLFWPWDVVPGLTPFTTRTVPPSARLAALYSRVSTRGNPNRAAAGGGPYAARYVLDLSQAALTDQQRLELNNAGVTVSRRRFGNSIATWGLRTLADQFTDADWAMAPNVRTIMFYKAAVERAMEAYEFDQVDGFGSALSKMGGDAVAIAAELHKKGALYGRTPEEAYAVSWGESLNPASALREGKVTIEADLRTSPGAEAINVRVVKYPITQSLV